MIRGRWYVLYSASDYASPPRDQISALLKQMTMFSSPCLLYLCVLFFPLLELQTVGAAQHDIDCSVVVCFSNLIKDHSCGRPCWLYTFLLTTLFQCPSKLIRNLLKLDFTWPSFRHHMVRWPFCSSDDFFLSNGSFLLSFHTMNFEHRPTFHMFRIKKALTLGYMICLDKS